MALALEIQGRVITLDGKPVPAAIVRERAEGGARAITGADGGFTLRAANPGRVRLLVTHPDYFDEDLVLSAREAAGTVIVTLVPLIRQNAEVVVTALRYPEPAAQVPSAGSVLTHEVLEERMAPNVTEALAQMPGVAPLGSGGFSLVPSIRGLSRNRILLLVDNARIVSDRRTGPNASFLNPEDLERIEVVRGPSSIFYGSDAIGGVINLFTKEPPAEDGFHGRLHAGYGTVNGEKDYGLSIGGRKGTWGFYLSFQRADADNYRSPLGEVLKSSFTQAGLLGKISYRTDARDVTLSFLGARGSDIGKPNRTSATKPTWYPRENQNLVQLNWLEKNVAGGQLNVHAYANPNFIETRTQTLHASGYVSKDSLSRTESSDFGTQLSYAKKWSAGFRLTAGLDVFGRSAAGATLKEESFNASGSVTKIYTETSYDRGRRMDAGVFVSGDYTGLASLDLVGGLRWDYLEQSAHPGGGDEALTSRKNAATGFLAASYHLTSRLIAFASGSTAYRTPGLSELFYTGITGRGMIIAQPGLTPERSLNWDAGLKWVSPRVYAAAYGFSTTIDGMIDRYLLSPGVYTYGNLDKARIRGLEFEAEGYPLSDWKIFGTLSTLEGKSVTSKTPINDIPPFRLVLGTRVWVGKFSAEVTGLIQRKKDNPGPAEIAIEAAEVFGFKANYFLYPVNVYLVVGNVFNTTYLGRPDPEAMEEPGRAFTFGISYSF